MLPDRVSNPGPLTYESSALPIALRGPAVRESLSHIQYVQTNPANNPHCFHDISSKTISWTRQFVEYDNSSMRHIVEYDIWSK